MSWPDLAALELLALTAEQGSLSRAAASCGVAQPNASRTIARLERQLGQALIVRTTTGSRLTPTGALIVRWAEPLLKTGAEFASAVAALRHDHAHELSILASQTVAECWAPAWLAGFHRVRGDTAVKMTVQNSSQIMDMLLNGDDRLGLIESPTVRQGLTSVPIGRDQLVVIVRADHPWTRRRRPLELRDLARTPLVVREEGSGTREVLSLALREFDPVEPGLVVGSNAGVLGSVIAGVGPAVMSERPVASAVAAGQVKQVPIREPERLQRTLHAVWPSGEPLLGAAADLLEAILGFAPIG